MQRWWQAGRGVLVLAALFLSGAVVSAAPQPEALAAEVEALVKKVGITAETPGVAVLVIQNGKVLLEKGYGLAHLKDKSPLTPHTTFELASVSKTFTSMAILRLHDQGKLAFEDDVRKYIKELPEYDPKHPIRIRNLLRHTSGLPEYFDLPEPKPQGRTYLTSEDYAGAFARHRAKFPLIFPTGSKYAYCNSNFLLLSVVVERISGKSYGTFLRDEIFRPLGMNGSWVYEKPQTGPRHPRLGHVNALSYVKEKKGVFKADWGSPPFRTETLLTTGDGAVWTSLQDMAKWDEALRGGKLLKPETWRKAMTPSRTSDGKTNDYGFGWGLELDDKGKLTGFGHNGAWGGFRTLYSHSLANDRTIVLLSNRSDFDPGKFKERLDGLLQGKKQAK